MTFSSSRMITLAALALALLMCLSGCSFTILAQMVPQETETPVSMSFSYDTEAMPAESHAAAPSSVQPISATSNAASNLLTRSDAAIATVAEPVSPQLSLTMDVIPNAAARQHAQQQQQATDMSNGAVEWVSADQPMGESSSSLSYSISSPLIKFNRSGADADAVSTNTSSAVDGTIFMGDRSNVTRGGVLDEKAHSNANRSSSTTAHNSTASSSMRGGDHGHGKSNSSTRSTSRDADSSSDDSSSSSSDSHKKRSNATMASSSTGGADGQLPLPNRTRGNPSSDDQSPSSDATHAALSLTWARTTALSWSAIALITALAQ